MSPPAPSPFQIEGRPVGGGAPCWLIGEVAQSHDGSLGQAHAFIDLAADCGLDAVKFQTHLAAEESTLDEPFRVRFSRQDETRYAYWKRMEFTPDQWAGLADHARERGLVFLSSPFSAAAVRLLEGIGMPAYKIGSGEFGSGELFEAVLATGKPVLLSTGMSAWADIEAGAQRLRGAGVPFALFQCTSEYPAAPERAGVHLVSEITARFRCPAGYSDHSGEVFAPLLALALGAALVEVHIAFHRGQFGPDVKASLVPEELRLLAAARDRFHRMASNPVDKDALARELEPMRKIFSKSLAPVRALSRGTVLAPGMLGERKPGDGIPPSELASLMGRRLARDVTPDRLLRPEDLE